MADAQSGTDASATDSDAPSSDPDTPPSESDTSSSDGSRSVLVESFRRAFGETDSYLLTSYAVVSAVLGGLVAVLLLLALPVWIFNTAGGSELATFSRAFLVVGGVLLLAGVAAPVVAASQRRARGTANRRVDSLLAAAGYLFVLALYLSLLISAPPGQRGTPPAVIAPAVESLYALPPVYAVAPPILAAGLIAAVHWFAR